MTLEAPRPPCPICGAERCLLVKNGQLGETCGNRTCAAKLRAQRMGPEHYARLSRIGGHSKRRTRSADWHNGYHAGYKAKRKAEKAEIANGEQ